MATLKKRICFFDSSEGTKIEETLKQMTEDVSFNTKPSYSANTTQYPDHRVNFVEKHMAYLQTHPSIDLDQYMSNLRLMTRIR